MFTVGQNVLLTKPNNLALSSENQQKNVENTIEI